MFQKLRSRLPLSSFVLFGLLVYPLAASAQDSDAKDDAGKAANKAKKADDKKDGQADVGKVPEPVEPQHQETKKDEPPKDLRIIRLKNSEPQQMLQLLAFWFHHKKQHEPGSQGSSALNSSARPAENLSMLMSDVHVATDYNTNAVFFRGPKEKLDELESVIAEFDAAPDEFQPQTVGGLYFTRVDEANMLHTGQLLSQLGIPMKNIMVGKTNFVVIQSSDDTVIEQAKKVIEFAQTPAKSDKKTSGKADKEGSSDNKPAAKPKKSPNDAASKDAAESKTPETKQSAPKKKPEASDE